MQCQSALQFWDTAISKFDHTMKIHGQGHVCGQRSRSRLTLEIQRSRLWSRSNPLVTFEAWDSIDMFALCFVAIGPFLLIHSKFYIWPWKFKVKVMAKVETDGHNWTLGFNRYVCFLFRCNRAISAEILKILYLTLKIQGKGYGQGQNRWSHLIPSVRSIYLLFVSGQSVYFRLRYSKFHIWRWKI